MSERPCYKISQESDKVLDVPESKKNRFTLSLRVDNYPISTYTGRALNALFANMEKF